MRLRASLAASAAALLATAAVAADPTSELRSNVTRLQQAQPGVRQGLTGLQAVPAGWDKTTSRFAQFVSQLEASGGAVDPNALVQYVLRESYLQTTEDLRFYAEKVKYFNAQKKLIREHLQKLRDADTRMKAAATRTAPGPRLAGLDQAVGRLDAQDAALEQVHEHLKHRAARLQALSPRDANIIAILIGLLRESIKEMNADKKYYLQRLQELNSASAAFSTEMKKLAEASANLSDEEKKVKRP